MFDYLFYPNGGRLKNSLLFLLMMIFVSCLPSNENLDLQTDSPFQGDWIGNFTGTSSGNLTFTVNNSGNLVGALQSNSDSGNDEITGYVMRDGRFAIASRKKYYFNGYLVLGEGKMSNGKWTNGDQSGTYFIKKKER